MRQVLWIVFAMFLVASCARQDSPNVVIEKYFNAYSNLRYEEAYSYLSSSDKVAMPLPEYKSTMNSAGPFAAALAGKFTYKVRDLKVSGKAATATVDITGPDVTAMMGELMAAAFSSAFSGQGSTNETMEKVAAAKLKSGSLPTATVPQEVNLVKEKDGWKILNNFEQGKKIEQLKLEAESLEGEKKLEAAKLKYEAIFKLDGKAIYAGEKINQLNKDIEHFKEAQAYIDKVEVRNLEVADSMFEGKGVFGEIKNLGDRTLTQVEITIFFLDDAGKDIYEKKYHPVMVSDFSFGSSNEPLKPNYSTKFGCKTEGAPSEWPGKVRVQVTDLKFA